ncbi:MAG: hypothetical protein AAF847_09940 [Bacteroidota bacterium]
MVKNKIILLLILFFHGLICQAQSYSQYSIDRVHKSLEVLTKEASDTSLSLADAYGSICFYYCLIKKHRTAFIGEEDDSFILKLIERDRHKYSKRYKTFLKRNIHCFSQKEYNRAKKYLVQQTSDLDLNDPMTYDLISLYQLKSFGDTLRKIADPKWFDEFKAEVETSPRNRNISKEILKRALPFVALANLGDKEIENSILSFIMSHVKTFDVNDMDRSKAWVQNQFYSKVIGQILSRLYSKESVSKTLDMIDNCLLVNDYLPETYDVLYTPLCWQYAGSVIASKLHPNCRDLFTLNNEYNLGSVGRISLETEQRRINKIKNAILQDDLELLKVTEEDIRSGMIPAPKNVKYAWSNIYTLWENEKK